MMEAQKEKLPVFTCLPGLDLDMNDCLGWAEDENQAIQIFLKSTFIQEEEGKELPGIGKTVFGGVAIDRYRVSTEDGPHRDRKGPYRWQKCYTPFFDSMKNAGKPTLLHDVFVYKRPDAF